MILARFAVYGAILCTLWFNGSYAWSKGGTEIHQYGMVAVATTIDLCKCGFLPAASHLWRNSWYVPATVLVLLWPLTFAYSTFSGFASITTNRSTTSAVLEGQAQRRARAQSNYDAATGALTLAASSPLWITTAACTVQKLSKHRAFCENVETTKSQQEAAGLVLNASTPAHVDPEVSVLKDNTGLATSTLQFMISAAPALILELVSSLGLYAISKRSVTAAPRAPAKSRLRSWLAIQRRSRKNQPMVVPEAFAVPPSAGPTLTANVPPSPTLTWKIPASG